MSIYIILWLLTGFVIACVLSIGRQQPFTVKDCGVFIVITILSLLSIVIVMFAWLYENSDRVLFDPSKWRKS